MLALLLLLVCLMVCKSIDTTTTTNTTDSLSSLPEMSERELAYIDRHIELAPYYRRGNPRIVRRKLTHTPTKRPTKSTRKPTRRPTRRPTKAPVETQYPKTWIDSFPEFGKTLLNSQPKGFVLPPAQSRRLEDDVNRKLQGNNNPPPPPPPPPPPTVGSIPISVKRLCSSNPADAFEDANCAMQYVKDRFYGNDDKPGVLIHSLKVVDDDLKRIKDKVRKMEKLPKCFTTSVANVKYEPQLPKSSGSTYSFQCISNVMMILIKNYKSGVMIKVESISANKMAYSI